MIGILCGIVAAVSFFAGFHCGLQGMKPETVDDEQTRCI